MKNKDKKRRNNPIVGNYISTKKHNLSTEFKNVVEELKRLSTEKSVLYTENCVQLVNYVFKATILIIIIPSLCTGCWDSMEINNRSVILEFCLDKNVETKQEKGMSIDKEQRYEMTYSIPDMAKLSGTESLAKDMKSIISIKAPTIGAGIDDLETKTRNTVSFSHVKALLLGQNLLRDSKLFKEAIDAISRDMRLARNVPILAVNGSAAAVAKVENPQHPMVGLYIMNYFNNKERPVSYFKHQLMGNFVKEIQDTGVSTMPIFKVGEEDSIEISGGAVIKNYELVDYLTKEEVRGQLLIGGQVKDSPVVVNYKNDYLTYIIKKQKSKIKFEKTSKGLICKVEIMTDGALSEYVSMPGSNIFNKESLEEMETLLEQEIDRQVQVTIDKSKEIETDFLQIGLELYRQHPKWWAEYEKEWQKGGYTNIPIEIKSSVNIRNTGVLQ